MQLLFVHSSPLSGVVHEDVNRAVGVDGLGDQPLEQTAPSIPIVTSELLRSPRSVLRGQDDDLAGGAVVLHVAVGVGDLAHGKDAVEVDPVMAVLHRLDDLLEDLPVAVAVDHPAAEAPQLHLQPFGLGLGALGVPVAPEESGDAGPAAWCQSVQRLHHRPGAHQLAQPVDPIGQERTYGGGHVAVHDYRAPDAARLQRRALGLLAGGGKDGEAAVLCDGDRGHPHRRGAAVHQQRLALAQSQLLQRAPGRTEALGDGPQLRPVQRRLHGDRLAGGQQRVLLVAAVVVAAHPAHRGDDPLPGLQVRARRLHDFAHALYAEHAGEADRVARAAGARDQLRVVQAERAHADQDPSGPRVGDRALLDSQHLWPTGPMNDDRLHRQRASQIAPPETPARPRAPLRPRASTPDRVFVLITASVLAGEFLPTRRKPILLSGLGLSMFTFAIIAWGENITSQFSTVAELFQYLTGAP